MRGFPALDFMALMPVAILALGALVLMLSEVFLTSARRGYQAWLTVAFAVIAGGNAVAGAVSGSTGGPIFRGQAVSDGFSTFVTVVVCAGLALSALVGQGWLAARDSERGEFYALALFSAAGMSLLGMATDLLVAFIAIEIMSLATYALAAFVRRGLRPTEAAFKYFLLGAFSSALFLYGAALVYGSTGNLLFSSLRHAQGGLLHLAGVALVVIGVAFKVAAVPFHAWTPDVYEGAPTPVTAFMAAGVKTAAFALLARFFLSTTSAAGTAAPMAIASVVTALALLTMLFGNLLALPQRSVKRMLAYSSIAHAGYLLVGVLAAAAAGAREKALSGILFYLASYTASAIGAFAVVGVIERRGQKDHEASEPWDLARFSGLAKRRPVLAFVMAVFLFSLAGVPPTAGFIGKLYVFQAAVGAELYGLAIFGILTSALGAYYYLRVVVFMYMKPAEGAEEGISSTTLSLALGVAAIAVVVLGLGADPIVRLAQLANIIL